MAVDKFMPSPEALARANVEKTTEDISQQGSGKLKLADLNGEGANLGIYDTRCNKCLVKGPTPYMAPVWCVIQYADFVPPLARSNRSALLSANDPAIELFWTH